MIKMISMSSLVPSKESLTRGYSDKTSGVINETLTQCVRNKEGTDLLEKTIVRSYIPGLVRT